MPKIIVLGDLLWIRTVTNEYRQRLQTPMRNMQSVEMREVLEQTQRLLERVNQQIGELNGTI